MSSCHGCNKAIVQDGIIALGYKYHPGCFKCAKCENSFSSAFVNLGGVPYHPECTPDDTEVTSKAVCELCKELVLEGRSVRIGQRFFHAACFKCFVCQQEINDGHYDVWEGQFCHERCTPNPICNVCRKSIDEKTLIIEGKTVHESCLTCATCNKIFEKSYVELDGRYYHEQCVPKTAGHIGECPVCKQDLCNPCVEVEGRTIHKQCFLCSKCKQPFTDTYAKVHNQYFHKACVE